MFVCLHTLTVHMLVCVCISNFLWLGGNKISLSRTLDLRWKIVHVFKEDRNCTEDLCPCLCHLLWVFAPLVRPKAKAFLGCSCEPADWKQSLVLCPNGFHGAHSCRSVWLLTTHSGLICPLLSCFLGSGATGLVPSCGLPVTCSAF